VIGAGDVQWMTAGKRHHSPGDASDKSYRHHVGIPVLGNLPAERKMMPPRYRDVPAATIPEVILNSGARVKVVSA